jgi:CheY-like chemotaxis protein
VEEKRILMIDDDREELMLLEDALFSNAHTIHYEENGVDALHYLEQCVDLPCLIILDLNMPRLNGTQILEKLKTHQKFKSIPVIIYSTSINNIEKEKCLKIGAADYIVKPVSYAETIRIGKYFLRFCNE